MNERPGYLQRQAESQVRIPRAARILLAIVLFLGAALFIVVGTVLALYVERPALPRPLAALLIVVLLVVPGVAFAYVGWRLLRIEKHTDHLLTARGGRIASYSIVVIGFTMVLAGWFMSRVEFAAAGLFSFLMAYWLHRSTKTIRADHENT